MATIKHPPLALPLLAGGLLLSSGCGADDDGAASDLEVAVGEWNLIRTTHSAELDYDWPVVRDIAGCTYARAGSLTIDPDASGTLFYDFDYSCNPDASMIVGLPFDFVEIPDSGFQFDFTQSERRSMDCRFDASLIVCTSDYDDDGGTAIMRTWTFEPA